MPSINWTMAVVVIFGLNLVGSPAKAAPPRCGVNLAAPEVTSAVNSLPPWQNVGQAVRWDATLGAMSGNFDPCATLSVALASVEMGTGSSPWQALMFHKGQYVGMPHLS